MSVLNASIVLVASFPDGRIASEDSFVRPLGASVGKRIVRVKSGTSEWEAANVEFINRSLDHYRNTEEPAEAFFAELAETLTFVAGWIDDRQIEFDRIRKSGLKVFLLINLSADQDQMELILPPAVLRAAGAAELPIQIITND